MRRFLLGFATTVVGASLLFMGWLAVTGWWAYNQAKDVQTTVAAASKAGADDPVAAAIEYLPQLQEETKSLADRLNSPPWSWAQGLPAIGESAYALGTLSAATADSISPQDDVFTDDLPQKPLAALQSLQGSLAAMATDSAEWLEPVQAIHLDHVLSPLQEQVQRAQTDFYSLSTSLTQGAAAAQALPIILGSEEQRNWLVVMQNTAEARGTGGLVGAYSIIKVRNGQFQAQTSDTNNSLGNGIRSLRGIPKDTRQLWGDDLATLWGLNLDRHFPYAAQLLPQTLPPGSSYPDEIVALDPTSVAALLRSTGPISVGDVTVTANNAESFFTRDIYTRFPDVRQKDAVVAELLTKTMTELSAQGDDLLSFWRALTPVLTDGHVLVASTHDSVQKQLEQLPTAGVVPSEPGPWATVAINDFAGSKFDAFIHTEVTYQTYSTCRNQEGNSTIRVVVHNRAPKNVADYADLRNDKGGGAPGSTKINVSVYAPVGSSLAQVQVDGAESGVESGESRNHPVWKRSLTLLRGETRTLEVEFAEPRFPGRLAQFSPQPMVNPMQIEVDEGCRSAS